MHSLDTKDIRILAILQKEGRIPMTELAERVGLSTTPCARRVAQMEKSGVISGYGARINAAQVGLTLTVFVFVELAEQSTRAVEDFTRQISAFDEVIECHLMSGSRDILLRIVARDLTAYDRFLERHMMQVSGIRSMTTSFALRPLVQRDTLPLA
ncbi:Lrp/AsnC family transcriptional regulator [Donghicola tyrosinivorans]|uniref:Lrp/AsnC family leucine-responsive transcriptional regulator n=1 Tax=Donghicola tyrosinivorans TaxID=1652492 RepID=A0A2T0X0M7_9RHOB|nr:Lrp/AsnC family transcriptional regulator [Donghicola tyrosinivorans]PRY92491.1 Lrp/AsnC family leucine-responsive transcriptional regulator [Donghicola tyrosinivorans]